MLNEELNFDLQVASQDRHGEVNIENFAQKLIQHAIAITRMREYRNGPTSAENTAIKRIRDDVIAYFGVEECDVNEIYEESELFREYFKLPKKGDRTWPDGIRRD